MNQLFSFSIDKHCPTLSVHAIHVAGNNRVVILGTNAANRKVGLVALEKNDNGRRNIKILGDFYWHNVYLVIVYLASCDTD